MNATNYNLTLNATNKMGPAFTGAAADAGDLTSVLRKQRDEARKLTATQKELGKFAELKQGLAATRTQLKKTQVELSGLAAEQKEAKLVVKSLGEQKLAASRKVKRLADQISRAGVPTAELSAKFKAAKARADELGDQLEGERARVKKLGAQFDSTRADASALKAEFNAQRAAAHKLGSKLRDAGIDTSNFARAQARLRREANDTNKALAAQKDKLKALKQAKGRAVAADARMGELQGEMAGTAAMVAGAVVPVARAVTMEAAMADVSKVTNFEGTEEQEFQSHLQRLAVDVNIPPEQLTQLAAAAGQSGIEKKDLAGFTGAAARMGVAFDMEAAEAGETMAAWRAGMGLNQQQAETLADAVNHVSNNMNAKARDISGVLKRQGAVATASGMSETQTASLAGALLAGGASEEVAATTMKNLLGALTKGDAATSSQQDAMETLGLDAVQLASGMQSDAIGTINQVFEALAGAPLEKQSALISQIFGEESKGGIMPLLKNQQLLQQAFGLTADQSAYAGSALEEYKNRAAVSEHRLGSAWRAIDRLGIVLGDSLLPVVGPVADGVAWLAGGLADLAEGGGIVTSVVTGLAASYVAYKAGALAWRMAQARIEQLRANAAVKGAEKEVRLATATDKTASKAALAARAMDRLNDALSRTARIRGGAAADYDLSDRAGPDADRSSKRTDGKPGADGKEGRRSRAGRRRRGGRLGRLLGGAAALRDKATGWLSGAGSAAVSVNGKSEDRPGLAARGWQAAKSMAGYGGGAAALMAVPDIASAATSVDISGGLDAVTDIAGMASDAVGSVGGLATKLFRPAAMLLDLRQLTGAVTDGSAAEVGESIGEIGGVTGGAVLGAAIGTAILPGVGTVLGSVVGGYLGGEGGAWIGKHVGSWFKSDKPGAAAVTERQSVSEALAERSATSDRLQSSERQLHDRSATAVQQSDKSILQRVQETSAGEPSALQQVQQQAAQQPQQLVQNQQISFTPQITINAPGSDAQRIAQVVRTQLQEMFNTSVMPALNPTLGGRLDDSMEIM